MAPSYLYMQSTITLHTGEILKHIPTGQADLHRVALILISTIRGAPSAAAQLLTVPVPLPRHSPVLSHIMLRRLIIKIQIWDGVRYLRT